MSELFYPYAQQRPLTDHSVSGRLLDRNSIVLHITEGTTANGAISTFASSVSPHRTSAHFVIDRDGTVYQLLPISDTAWHASQCNAHSVGIEHVALSAVGATGLNQAHAAAIANGTQRPFLEMLATDSQYEASGKLVAWLCQQIDITCDRAHVRTHHEASPADHHDLCCTGALDPDRVVAAALAHLSA